jgi:hypothetical protein
VWDHGSGLPARSIIEDMHYLHAVLDHLMVVLLVSATSSPAAGRPINAALPYHQRVEVVQAIVRESRRHDIDPTLVLAVAWAESGLDPTLVYRTDDYCYLQVHWFRRLNVRRGETWLVGVDAPHELLDIQTCARAGVAELAFWRRRCRSSRRTWWQCYKWGYRVPPTDRYVRRVSDRHRWLRARIRRVQATWRRGAKV